MAQKKDKKQRISKLGAPPGTLIYTGDRSGKINITHFQFDTDSLKETSISSWEKLEKNISENHIDWVEIDGIHSVELTQQLAAYFQLNVLQQEDLLNANQGPKLDVSQHSVLVFIPHLYYHQNERRLENKVASFVLNKHLLVSLRDTELNIYRHIKERLQPNNTRLRALGSDYLLYALIDLHVDHYHQISEMINEEIMALEEDLMVDTRSEILDEINKLKKVLFEFRKRVYPIRDIIRKLKKQESELQVNNLNDFYSDLEDHINEVVDNTLSQIEMLGSLFDSYMSSISLKMNEVMKTLTIVGAIFIPLTFLAGIYGMNFQYIPELEYRYGYFVLLGVMLVVVLILLFYFKKKRWF